MADPIRVLIADDQQQLLDAYVLLIDSEPGLQIVGVASDGARAVELTASLAPDIVLMDIQMPRMGGLEATRAICAAGRTPRVIVLTMFDRDDYVYQAIRAGASGFLLKNAPPAAILQAVRVVYDGTTLLAPEVTKRLISTLSPASAQHERAPDYRLERLTARERETFILIARGRSNDEIGRALVLTPMTVRTYVSRILSKVGARDRAQLVMIAYESGLVTAAS